MFELSRKPLIYIAFAIAVCFLFAGKLQAQSNQTVNAGSQTAAANFPTTTCTYNWTNSNPAIGLPASGTGNIAAFTATNTTGSPITATITGTPTGPSPEPPLLYIPNSGSNNVSVINAFTNTLLTTVPVGTFPYNVMVSHDYNRVWVSNQNSNDVSVIYMPTNRVLATIPGFTHPGAIASTTDNLRIFVANSGTNTVSEVSGLSYSITNTMTVGQNPTELTLSLDGSTLYVANDNDATISVINTATRTVTNTIPVDPRPGTMLLSPDQQTLYVVQASSTEITIISTATNTVVGHITNLATPRGMAISHDGSRLYISNEGNNTVTVINTATNAVISTIAVGNLPGGLSISDDGSLLYVVNTNDNNVMVINTTSLTIVTAVNVGSIPFSIGNFYLTRADCSAPISFNITVNAAIPTITTSGTPSAVTTTQGRASASTSFTASGTNLTGNLLITPPTGFEVSLDNINFYGVVTINGPGNVGPSPVYLRLENTDAAGNYSGNITLTSAGATTVNVAMPTSTVTAIGPTITTTGIPFAVTTTVGTASPSTTLIASGTNLVGNLVVTAPAGFEVSLDNTTFYNVVTINGPGNVGPSTVYIRLKNTDLVGNYSGNIVLSSVGAVTIPVSMPQSTVTSSTSPLITAGASPSAVTTTYGTASSASTFTITGANLISPVTVSAPTGFEVSPDGVIFSPAFTISATSVSSAKTVYIRLTPTAAAGTHSGNISISSISAATVQVAMPVSTVYTATLTITAADQTKNTGTTLTGGVTTNGYSYLGLQNGETITNVTITYGAGSASADAAGTYPGSVVPSNITGANGFLVSNYTINYVPGNLTVLTVGALIVTSGPLTALNTVYGTPSPGEAFTVTGTNLVAGILITAPNGFEVSADDINFTPTVAIGNGSDITGQIIYIRLKATSPVGAYTGFITFTTPRAVNTALPIPTSNVTPATLFVRASNYYKIYGTALSSGSGYTQFSVSAGSLKNGETVSSVTVAYSGGQLATSTVGTYTNSISISQAVGPGSFSASNYNITYTTADLGVNAQALTYIADPQYKQYGQPNPTLTYTTNGFVNGEDESVLITKPTISTTGTLNSAPGTYPITISGGAATNYTFTYVPNTLTIGATPGQAISIPSAFTPNGDGINDVWNITNLNTYPQSRVQIFSRYGSLLYNSVGYANPWDGTMKNAKLPDGVYYYIITLQPGAEPVAGSVTVIR